MKAWRKQSIISNNESGVVILGLVLIIFLFVIGAIVVRAYHIRGSASTHISK